MRDGRTGTEMIYMILLALLCGLLFTTGSCTKKEAPAEGKASAGQKEGGHQEGTVELTPEGIKTAGIEVSQVKLVTPSEHMGTTAVVEANGDRISRVGARNPGRCVKVLVSLGDRVKAHQVLAQIDSVDMDQTWTDYVKARAQLELAKAAVKREETLFQKGVSPEKDLLRARQEFSHAEADMLLAREKFRILGVDVRQVDSKTGGTSHNHPLISVMSPLSGVVIERSVTQGEMVGPEKTLFTVADLSTLWLMIDIFERDMGRVKTGMQVKLISASYPGKEFKGRISYVGDVMDEKSRTVKARVTIENQEGLLKPGMFVSASISSPADDKTGKIISVPEEAVFLDGSQRYVFIKEADAKFRAKEIVAGPVFGGAIEIKEGLKEGDTVVIKGVFALKSELKKKMLGDER